MERSRNSRGADRKCPRRHPESRRHDGGNYLDQLFRLLTVTARQNNAPDQRLHLPPVRLAVESLPSTTGGRSGSAIIGLGPSRWPLPLRFATSPRDRYRLRGRAAVERVRIRRGCRMI